MKPAEMTHTIKVVAVKYIPGTSESQRWQSGQRPRVALLFWLDVPAFGDAGVPYRVPCYHEMPVSKARPLGFVMEGWNSGRHGWFLRGQSVECRVSYYGDKKPFAFDGGPAVKQPDGRFTRDRWVNFHHAKITRYGTITGGERQTAEHLEEAFRMGAPVVLG